jgi:hypothetical protein
MLDMRYAESKIKEAILHPEEEVRLTALSYFADSFTDDKSIMPLVIEVVEKYGRESAFRVLRDAERLPQTEATLDWLLSEIRRDYDLSDVGQDNYRFATALAVLAAPLDLLAQRGGGILECSAFPKELRPALKELVEMAPWDWHTGWGAFTKFGENLIGKEGITQNDLRRLHRFIKSLARFRDDGADQILALLKRQYRGTNKNLMVWMEPWIVELAGHMRIKEAIPFIIERFYDDDDTVRDECGTALAKIGGDEVVKAITDIWFDSDEEFCGIATDALQHIHTDLCAEKCLEFLAAEEDFETRLMLGNAVLAHFTLDGIEPVRQLVLGDDDDLEPDQFDLRYKLIATATVMGTSFPEYSEWYKDALGRNYGWYDYQPARIAENFRADDVGNGGNGKPK